MGYGCLQWIIKCLIKFMLISNHLVIDDGNDDETEMMPCARPIFLIAHPMSELLVNQYLLNVLHISCLCTSIPVR